MKKLSAAAAIAGAVAAIPGPLSAQATAETRTHTLSANLGLVTEYRYRGIGQTNGDPAVQAGLDYTHSSGAYAGTWWTNVSWLSDANPDVSSSLEVDVYAGYRGSFGQFGYDVGVLRYLYPGSYPHGFTSPHTTELYVAGSWQMFTLKYSHAVTNLFGFDDSEGAGYLELNGSFELGAGLGLLAHVGHQRIPAGRVGGVEIRSRDDCSYTDWSLGLTKGFVGLDWKLSWIDTNADGGTGECYRNALDRDVGKSVLVLSVGKTF
ncbi:MAG TPA: TorF family putative porin [Burkholderiaceae bacterium]|nr:TorF family putative porin [Burkholderiaceae bacterium]